MSQTTPNNKDPFDIEFDDAFFESLNQEADPKTTTNKALVDDLEFLEQVDTALPDTDPKSERQDEQWGADEFGQATHQDLEQVEVKDDLLTQVVSDETGVVSQNDKPDELLAATPIKAKRGLFGGKAKTKPSKSAKPSLKSKNSKAKKGSPIALILGVMAVVLVVGLLWVFLGGGNGENTPMPEMAAVSEPAASTAAPAPAPIEAPAPTPTQTAPQADGGLPTLLGNAEPIDAEAIVQAEVPADPALIKEEIDRLADKDTQFAEQAKLIDEQLAMMQELTTAKEEQIALLEAQIAQLEAQKGK